jgi:hypothetical protein
MRLYRTFPELKKERHLALWHKALRARWSPEDVDLARPLALGAATRDALARILSPVLMGEQAGLYSITTMIQVMGREADVESQMFLTTMAVDEAKHTELFTRYYGRLEREPLAIRRFPSGYLFQTKVMSQEPTEWLTGSLVSECLAKLTLEELRRIDFDPVFHEICARILEDEARHLGFNHVFLEERLGGNDQDREPQRAHLRARLEAVLASVPPILAALAPDIRRLGIDADDFYDRLRDDTTRRLERSIAGGTQTATRPVAPESHARDSA